LEGIAAPRAQHEMQVRAHVGKFVDSHIEPTCHTAQNVAHGATVRAQRPRASGSMTRQNHVHRASRADGTLELAPTATDVAAVNGPRELGLRSTIEKGQLHASNVIILRLGAMSFRERSNGTDGEGSHRLRAVPSARDEYERARGALSGRFPCRPGSPPRQNNGRPDSA
jgi:hypothetical protein